MYSAKSPFSAKCTIGAKCTKSAKYTFSTECTCSASRNYADTISIPIRLVISLKLREMIRRWVAGWVGRHTSIIEPLRGPTCKLELCKISSRVEIPSWTGVWQKYKKREKLRKKIKKK